jgi:hypothetical protein
MSENYWLVDELATDNNDKIESMKKNVKENTLSVNPNFGQYVGNTALTTARAVPRAMSYMADIPNLLAEGTAYGKNKFGRLDQSKYGDAGYQGFGTAIPSLLKQDDANPLLNIFQPHGSKVREANPLSLFDDKNKISGAGYGILPSENTVTYATDFAVFDKFGLNKIPKVLGGKSGYNNPFGGMQSAQAVRSAIIGGGAYNLGMFDSLTGIGATIVTDVLSRKVTSKVGANNTKQYLERVIGKEGLVDGKYQQWSNVIKNVENLDDLWVNWTGKKRTVADKLNDKRINDIVGMLQGSEAGQKILGEWFTQRGLALDKTVQERFKPFIDMVKDNSGRDLSKFAMDNLVKHYDGVNKTWREIIGKKNLSAPITQQMKIDSNLLLTEFERLKSGSLSPNNQRFIETQVLPTFFNIEKTVVRDKNGKIVYDANRNQKKKTTYKFKNFKNVDDFITARNELNAQINSFDSKAQAKYGQQAKDYIKYLDEQVIAKNVNKYNEAKAYKKEQVAQYNKNNQLTADVFASWEQLGKTGNSSILSGNDFMQKSLQFMSQNPSPKTIQAFIKMLKKTGNGAVLEQLLPHYVSNKLKNVVKDGKKAELNQVKIYQSLVETSADFDNLTNWFAEINKNLNPNKQISHTSFKKSLDEFKLISDEMFRPIQNSNTFQKQAFKGNMEKSSSANILSILKLDLSMGIVGGLKEWKFNTNTKMLAELMTSTDGVALLNSLAKASSREQKLKIFETIVKLHTVAYAETYPDRKAKNNKINKVQEMEKDMNEAEVMRNDIIGYWQ